MAMALGMLLVWITGYFLPWRSTAFLNLIPPTLLFIVMLALPESPYWLIEENDHEKAR
jgi:MFS family permease